jgi:hypothetical protein
VRCHRLPHRTAATGQINRADLASPARMRGKNKPTIAVGIATDRRLNKNTDAQPPHIG